MADALKMYRLKNPRIVNNAEEAANLIERFRDHNRERLIAIHLRPDYLAFAVQVVAIGTMSKVHFEMHDVFRKAILRDTKCLIVAHNHPYEREIRASRQDVELTESLVSAGKALKIPVLDHLIVTRDSVYSFRATGVGGYMRSREYAVAASDYNSMLMLDCKKVDNTISIHCGRRRQKKK